MKKPDLRFHKPGQIVEAAGIAPASREASVRASTCVADRLIVGVWAPVGRVPFSLSRHEFNPGRNKRLGQGDPELASPAESLGRRPGARPLLFFRQRDGEHLLECQLSFSRLFTRPADQPRHATVHFGHPVDPGSPPQWVDCFRQLDSYYLTTGIMGRAAPRSSLLALAQGPVDVALGFLLLERLTLVIGLTTAGDRKFDLGDPLLEVDRQGNERQTLLA
jgi:hypothetical protein